MACALCVLLERGRIPMCGGVATAGIALRNTSLLERLRQAGVAFDEPGAGR